MLKEEQVNILRDSYYKENKSEKVFLLDTEIFNSITRMIKRFTKKGEINEKLLMNNIIIAINCFGYENSITVLYSELDDFGKTIVASFFEYIGYNTKHISSNSIVAKKLKDSKKK